MMNPTQEEIKKILLWIAAIVVGFVSFVIGSAILSIVFHKLAEALGLPYYHFVVNTLASALTFVTATAVGFYNASWIAPMKWDAAAKILFQVIRALALFATGIFVARYFIESGAIDDIDSMYSNDIEKRSVIRYSTLSLSVFLGAYLGRLYIRKVKLPEEENSSVLDREETSYED